MAIKNIWALNPHPLADISSSSECLYNKFSQLAERNEKMLQSGCLD